MDAPNSLRIFIWLLFVPIAVIATVAARHWLPRASRLRRFLETHGAYKVGMYLLLAVWGIGGFVLANMYS